MVVTDDLRATSSTQALRASLVAGEAVFSVADVPVQVRASFLFVANIAYHGETRHADEFDVAVHQESVCKNQSSSIEGHSNS
jgi:hypothetical protein